MRRIAAVLAGAAVFAAAPAYAANPKPTVDVEAYENERFSLGNLESPIQVDGRFYAVAEGNLAAYDWTTGKWEVVTSPLQGRDLRQIATDGTTLVALTTGKELLYLSDGAWSPTNTQNFTPAAVEALASGQGFVAIIGAAFAGAPLVSTDGGRTYNSRPNLNTTDGQSPLMGVAPDYGCGIQWVFGPHRYTGQWDLVASRGFTKISQYTPTMNRDGGFHVANLGYETWVVAKDGSFARYWDACNPDGVRPATATDRSYYLLAVPGLGGVYEISGRDDLYQRIGTERTDALADLINVSGMVDYKNTLMVTSDDGYNWIVAGDLPPMGWEPTTDKEAGVGNEIPDVPPLVPPPDVPAVIDGDHSVIMPDLGVTPKNEDGQPVMAGAAPWKPNANGWCEWRGSKVACVSEMDPLPEADDLYTLKANLSGSSKSQQGACRWTTTKPQCRVWLTQPGKWRLTWSGSNNGKMVSGARTVIVK